MDRFKFRAWDKEENGMSKPFTINELALTTAIPKYVIDNYIIMQCTGLKDRNGKLIFEGDIARFTEGEAVGLVWEVVWCLSLVCFHLHCRENGVILRASSSRGMDGEIIGNTYEHRGLLNEQGPRRVK